MATISTKKVWVSTSGWRGYMTYTNAVGGANDTGSWDDSPCPSSQRKAEIDGFIKKLKVEKIKYRTLWGQTSNVFCVAQFVLVAPEDHERAYEIAELHAKETSLFYPCEKVENKKEAV